MRRGATSSAVRAFVLCLAGTISAAAHAAEIVYADGRRETVQDPKQDSKGAWIATCEGRRTILKPGEVVAIVDDAGAETVTIPPLAEGPDAPDTAALLASLRDPKNAAWMQAADQLGAKPTRSLLDTLVALASDAKPEMRRRAIAALARLRTRESVAAAAKAVLAEKDGALRREASSVLYSVGEIFKRADTADLVRSGLADRDAPVRLAFATLAAAADEAAKAVLRKDGLGSGDHHVREAAAVELGERGDGAGESVLVGMLGRARVPGIDDPGLTERVTIREKVGVCRILGKLGTDAAKAALRKAAAAGPDAVRKAAEEALAASAAK